MKASDVKHVPEDFRVRLEMLIGLAEGDGRDEAISAVVQLLQKERDRLPDGPAWREVKYLQDTIESADFKAAIPRGRRR